MTITLELPIEIETKLTAEAEQNATSVDKYALNLIEEGLMADPSDFKTGAEVVAYWMKHGLIGIWADREDIGDSVEYAHKLRQQAEKRGDD
ncbi:MAG: hypothetical protein ACRYFS_04880 [Janthinobacterium lividum]